MSEQREAFAGANTENRLGKCVLGKDFKNPVILASGTVGFGREIAELYPLSKLGGIVSKGITLEKRLGNAVPRIAEVKSGILNFIGLQNPGVDAVISNEIDFFTSQGTVSIANICGNTVEDYQQVADKLSQTPVDLLELNISCPNVKEGKGLAFGVEPKSVEMITEAVKPFCRQPLIVKLTPNISNIADNAKAAEAGGADAISLTNTLAGMDIDYETGETFFGGLSGPAMMPVALRMTNGAYKAVKIPVIGMGGISDYKDAIKFMRAGASLVQVGTLNMTNPMAVPEIVENMQRYFEEKGYKNTDDIIGQTK